MEIKFDWDPEKAEINLKKHNVSFEEAKTVKGMPTAIVAKTVKGKGVSFMENLASWHGTAPNHEQYEIAMADLNKILAELEA